MHTEPAKKCTKCLITKLSSDFSKAGKNGLHTHCKTCSASHSSMMRAKHPVKIMLRKAKERATEKGFAFDITEDDIVIPEYCPVLGIKLVKGTGRPHDNSPSIDKVIPSLGYIRGNVQVISYKANTIKSDATLEQLQALVRYVQINSRVQ